jgi:hypothetical protein
MKDHGAAVEQVHEGRQYHIERREHNQAEGGEARVQNALDSEHGPILPSGPGAVVRVHMVIQHMGYEGPKCKCGIFLKEGTP